MNRLLKFITTLLVVIVLLGVIAAVMLPRLIDPNDYRDDISKLVHENSGLTLSIDGPIGWSVFPWVGLSLEDVSVKGVNDQPLARLGQAEISVKVMPLLKKQVEMQTVTVNGLELSLVKDKNGKGNWEVEKPASAKSTEPTTEQEQTPAPTEEKTSGLPVELNIASVEITNLLFSYDDLQAGKKYLINQASMTTGPIRNQQPVDFNLKSRISIPDLVMRAGIKGTLTVNVADGKYSVSNLDISANPDVDKAETVSLVGHINLVQEPLLVDGELDVKQFNPKALLSQIKVQLPAMADKNAMTRLSFDSKFSTDGKSFDAPTLSLKLDDFKIDGQFQVTDLNKQSMKFSFNGNDLNLDNYLPPASNKPATSSDQQKTSTTSKAPATASGKAAEQPLIPEDMLRGLNIDGSMELASLTVAGFRFDKPSVSLKAANSQQDVKIGSGFYQGKISLNTKLDVRKKGTPKISTTAALKGIDLEALAQPIPALQPVHGLVNADLNVATSGQYQSVLTKNLNGKTQFSIDKGVFTNANFDKLVCEGIASIRKKDLNKSDWGDSTNFKDLSGTFVIRNGVATNNNLIASLSNLNLKGDGKIDLVQQYLDYHMGLNIRGSDSPDSDPACQVNDDYADVTWPVRCEGNIGTQQCGIDSERLADTVAGLLKNEAQKRIKKEIEDKVQGPVKDLLKGLFK